MPVTVRKSKRKGTIGFRAAVDAKCRECIYDPKFGHGTWRQQTEACTSPKCPLYPLRPTSSGMQERWSKAS